VTSGSASFAASRSFLEGMRERLLRSTDIVEDERNVSMTWALL
jgi:hypothetical protein